MNFNGNVADFGQFGPTLVNLLHCNAYKRLIQYSRAHTQIIMGSIVGKSQNLVILGRKTWTLRGEMTKFTKKSCFEVDFDFSIHFFSKYTPKRPQNTELSNQVTPLVFLGGLLIIK